MAEPDEQQKSKELKEQKAVGKLQPLLPCSCINIHIVLQQSDDIFPSCGESQHTNTTPHQRSQLSLKLHFQRISNDIVIVRSQLASHPPVMASCQPGLQQSRG
jgi:hypothetical protein